MGDINGDGVINVNDIVMVVDLVLDQSYDALGDVNGDGTLNVIDLVIYIDMILNP